jgi:small subunit ribosomal protein S16
LVKIRLRRTGKKKQPSYRIVVADSRMPRDGRYIESLGFYNPMTEPSSIRIDAERALYWLGQGAQPSRQVQNLMKIEGIWDQFKTAKT